MNITPQTQLSVQFFKLHAAQFLTRHEPAKKILPPAVNALEPALFGFKYYIIQ